MVSIISSGSKQATDVFFNAVSELVQGNKLKCNLENKEYSTYDGKIRRYFDFDLSSVPADIERIRDTVTLELRINGSETEVKSMMKVLRQMGVLLGKTTKNGKPYLSKMNGKVSLTVKFKDKFTVAKKKLLEGVVDDHLVML